MPNITLLVRFSVLCVALWLVGPGPGGLRAQPAANTLPPKSASPDELSQAELLKAYLQLREQLHAAELALVNTRLETEANARAQAAAITQKLDGIKSEMAAERERQQAETQRLAAERERQEAEAQRTNRTILWIASTIGGVGLLAMLFTALFQWRAIDRMAEATTLRPQLAAAGRQGLLADVTAARSGEAVALSNQRLLSVIDRMERRILELEQTALHPLPSAAADPADESESARNPTASSEHAERITALQGKGSSLLSTNRVKEAVACFDEVLKLDPNHAETLVKKGAALERLNQDREALECYDRAIKADRKMTIAYLSKGRVCNRLQLYDEAVECYQQALPPQEEENPSAVHA